MTRCLTASIDLFRKRIAATVMTTVSVMTTILMIFVVFVGLVSGGSMDDDVSKCADREAGGRQWWYVLPFSSVGAPLVWATPR